MEEAILEHKDEVDSLEELRRMIKATKIEIKNYAGDLYTLKETVSQANIVMKEAGNKGVDEGVMWDMDY